MHPSPTDNLLGDMLALQLVVTALLHEEAARKDDPRAWLAQGMDRLDAVLSNHAARPGQTEADRALREAIHERAMATLGIVMSGALPVPAQSPGNDG